MTEETITYLPTIIADRQLHERLDKKGKETSPSHANLALILKHDPALKGLVSINEFSCDQYILKAPPVIGDDFPVAPGPYPRKWHDTDAIRVLTYVQKVWSPAFKRATVEESIAMAARDNGFHPVRSWLDGLVWDQKPRLEQWLTQTFGVPLDKYHKAVAAKFLAAAVRRVKQPGCKFDYMMVLEGSQGIGKSRAIAALFGQQWVTDQISDLSKKDAAIDLAGKWAIEFSEIEHLIKADVETVKAFLSRSIDHYRGPWERTSSDHPRQCVLIGTTNSTEYLRDTTGNRRIWPVRCLSVENADLEWLTVNRDQIWAEACVLEKAGCELWLDDGEIRDQSVLLQGERMEHDAWEGRIQKYILGLNHLTTADILEHGVGLYAKDHGRSQSLRVAAIMKANGWRLESHWDSAMGKNVKKWSKPNLS